MDLIEQLIKELSFLPSVGRKSAQRLAYFLLKQPTERVHAFSQTILNVRQNIKSCQKCYNYSEQEFCFICQNKNRDESLICVVEHCEDIPLIEKFGQFNRFVSCTRGVFVPFRWNWS